MADNISYRQTGSDLKKFIIIGVVCVFVVAPTLAKVTSLLLNKPDSPQDNISALTKEEAETAIADRNKELSEDEQFNPDFTVTSIKQVQKWWYLATVNIDDSNQPVLLSKFTNDSYRALTSPGSGLPYFNMSDGQGVPYEAIDALNESFEGDE